MISSPSERCGRRCRRRDRDFRDSVPRSGRDRENCSRYRLSTSFAPNGTSRVSCPLVSVSSASTCCHSCGATTRSRLCTSPSSQRRRVTNPVGLRADAEAPDAMLGSQATPLLGWPRRGDRGHRPLPGCSGRTQGASRLLRGRRSIADQYSVRRGVARRVRERHRYLLKELATVRFDLTALAGAQPGNLVQAQSVR